MLYQQGVGGAQGEGRYQCGRCPRLGEVLTQDIEENARIWSDARRLVWLVSPAGNQKHRAVCLTGAVFSTRQTPPG